MIKILHFVGGLNAGGTETWLRDLARFSPKEESQLTFGVFEGPLGLYEADIKAAGCQILRIGSASRPERALPKLRGALRAGNFDVVHAHVHHFSGAIMAVAREAQVPVRVVQSHTSATGETMPSRRVYAKLMRALIRRYATHRIAVSAEAARAFFGPLWGSAGTDKLLYCGIDLTGFRAPLDRLVVRAGLGIPEGFSVMVHVGRLVPLKNQGLMLRSLKLLNSWGEKVFLLVVGDGPLRYSLQEQARALGIEKEVIFTGTRTDARELIRASDIFCLPSLFEGLPLSAIEAQAAGLPCLISDTITAECAVVDALVHRCPPDAAAEVWARAVQTILQEPCPDRAFALRVVEESPFNITKSVGALYDLYTRSPEVKARITGCASSSDQS